MKAFVWVKVRVEEKASRGGAGEGDAKACVWVEIGEEEGVFGGGAGQWLLQS